MQHRFKTRVLTESSELRAITAEWSDLCDRCPESTPFQRPAWIMAWIEAFCPTGVAAVEVRSQNRLVGFAPLLIYPRGHERVLAFMAGGVSDYLDFLVGPGDESGISIAILNAITELPHWNVLDLTDVPAISTLHRTIFKSLAAEHDRCSFIPLPQTQEELLHFLSKGQRANLRNSCSRLKKVECGQIEVATAGAVLEFLSDLFRLHTSRWSQLGQTGVLADQKIKSFHQICAPALVEHGILRLYRLRLKDKTIAVTYNLVVGQNVFCYLQGFDPEFGYFSPGTQLMFHAMRDAIKTGGCRFDLLRGAEEYKRHWRAHEEHTYRIQLPRNHVSQLVDIQVIAA